MIVTATDVSKGRHGHALPPTTLAYRSGQARLATAETEQRPTVLGLIATGRMQPETGEVRIDGEKDATALRRRSALVDAPLVSDPAPNVAVYGVVAEELMFAGRASSPGAARRWLQDAGLGAIARTPIADIAPRERLRLLMELAAIRPGVEGLVLVSPDRHGGDPAAWWQLAEEFAGRGFAVLVLAGEASDAVLAGRAVRATAALPGDASGPEPDQETARHTEPAQETAHQAEPDPQTARHTEPNPQTTRHAEPNPQTTRHTEPAPQTARHTEPAPEPGRQAEPDDMETEPAAEPHPEPAGEPDRETGPDPEPHAEPDPETDPEPDPKPDPETDPEPDPKPDPAPDQEAGPETGPGEEAEPDPAPDDRAERSPEEESR